MADLFRAYGKAALYAAGVENNLILVIALVKSQGHDDDTFSREHKKLERKTLGRLIQEAKDISIFSSESYDNLSLILKHRNWMVHNIARESFGFTVQKNGDEKLVRTLDEFSKFFWGASELIYEKITELMEERGVKQETVSKLLKAALEANLEPNKALKSDS